MGIAASVPACGKGDKAAPETVSNQTKAPSAPTPPQLKVKPAQIDAKLAPVEATRREVNAPTVALAPLPTNSLLKTGSVQALGQTFDLSKTNQAKATEQSLAATSNTLTPTIAQSQSQSQTLSASTSESLLKSEAAPLNSTATALSAPQNIASQNLNVAPLQAEALKSSAPAPLTAARVQDAPVLSKTPLTVASNLNSTLNSTPSTVNNTVSLSPNNIPITNSFSDNSFRSPEAVAPTTKSAPVTFSNLQPIPKVDIAPVIPVPAPEAAPVPIVPKVPLTITPTVGTKTDSGTSSGTMNTAGSAPAPSTSTPTKPADSGGTKPAEPTQPTSKTEDGSQKSDTTPAKTGDSQDPAGDVLNGSGSGIGVPSDPQMRIALAAPSQDSGFISAEAALTTPTAPAIDLLLNRVPGSFTPEGRVIGASFKITATLHGGSTTELVGRTVRIVDIGMEWYADLTVTEGNVINFTWIDDASFYAPGTKHPGWVFYLLPSSVASVGSNGLMCPEQSINCFSLEDTNAWEKMSVGKIDEALIRLQADAPFNSLLRPSTSLLKFNP